MVTMPKVLYIDDDDIDRMVLERYSRAFSFHLDTCNSVASAKACLNNGYDGFVIDWNLGDGDGVEIAREARKSSPASPLIFISGAFDVRHLKEACIFSPLACIEKGGSPDYARDILALLEKHLCSQKK